MQALRVNRRKYHSRYSFQNEKAGIFFAALETAEFTEAQSETLYSLTFRQSKEAIDIFFVALVTAGIESAIKALYLYIGGTATTHAINAINPGTFNATWVGSPAHSATGTSFNGTNQYGKTGLIPSVDLTLNDTSISVYTQASVPENSRDIGAQNSGSQRILFDSNRSDGKILVDIYSSSARINAGVSGKGQVLVSRRVANDMEAYHDKVSQATTTNEGGTLTSFELYLSALNSSGSAVNFASKEHSNDHIGDSMITTEVEDFYDAVQAKETTLGRAV